MKPLKKVGDERLKRTWHGMKWRCSSKATGQHRQLYFDRGIRVCDAWKQSFESFRRWAYGNGYADNLTIDRIDSGKDYCPENCQWLTRDENAEKSRVRVSCEFDGVRYASVLEMSKARGWSQGFAWDLHKSGIKNTRTLKESRHARKKARGRKVSVSMRGNQNGLKPLRFEGMEFESTQALADFLGLSATGLWKQRKTGKIKVECLK